MANAGGETTTEVPLSDAGVVILRGLKGPLVVHNNLMSREFELIETEGETQQYRVKLEGRKLRGQKGATIELVVNEANLRGCSDNDMLDTEGWYAMQQRHDLDTKGRKTFALSNRSSVKQAVEHILSQIERQISMSKER
jgi:hypothetical protein